MPNGTTGYVNMTQCDLKLLETLNEVPDVGDCWGCMWILERCFFEDYGRRECRKMNVVSENKKDHFGVVVKVARFKEEQK
jgi:hypothetical protein